MIDDCQGADFEFIYLNNLKPSKNASDHVIAISLYNSERNDELNIEVNDIINVIERSYSKWWYGRNERTGQTGLFPSKLVQDFNSDENNNILALEKATNKKSIVHSNSKRNGNIYFDSFASNSDNVDNDSVSSTKEHTLRIDSNQLNKEQTSSQKRFNVIMELIDTEEKYIKELNFTLQNFNAELIQKSCQMSREEINEIIGHLQRIYEINLSFFENLKIQNKTDESLIGSTMIDSFKQMLPIYKSYCSSKVAELMIKIDENDQIGAEKSIYQSGMVLPMRRIIKYPLMIENLLKNTLDSHSDYEDCQRAFESCKMLCQQIDKIYDKMCLQVEPIQKLQWIQKHVFMPGNQVDQIIEFNSETRFLGRRILLHSGILFSNSKLLFAFLFNDFLLLAKPNELPLSILEDSTRSINLFKHKDTRHLKCTLHEKPFLLNDLQVADLDESELCSNLDLFRLEIKSLKKHISFEANSIEEWDNWIQKINHAKDNYSKTEQMFRDIDKGPSRAPHQKPIAILTLVSVEALQLYSQNYALNTYCKVAVGKDWSQAYSITTSDTVRRVMNSQKVSKEEQSISKSFLSKLKEGIVKNSLFGNSDDMNEENQRLIWKMNSHFDVHHCDDVLFVRCYDANPFAPHQFMGETKLPISKILHQNRFTNESFTAWIYLDVTNEKQSANFLKFRKRNVSPHLMLTFGLAINTDVDSIKRLYNLNA